MNILEITLLVLTLSVSNLMAFYLGAKLKQKVDRNEELRIPDPIKVVKQMEHKKEQKKEVDKIDKIFANIDKYDGTPNGQHPLE